MAGQYSPGFQPITPPSTGGFSPGFQPLELPSLTPPPVRPAPSQLDLITSPRAGYEAYVADPNKPTWDQSFWNWGNQSWLPERKTATSESDYLGRFGDWVYANVARPTVSPFGLATVPLAAASRPAAIGLSLLGGGMGAHGAMESVPAAIEDPTMENILNVGLHGAMAASPLAIPKIVKGITPPVPEIRTSGFRPASTPEGQYILPGMENVDFSRMMAEPRPPIIEPPVEVTGVQPDLPLNTYRQGGKFIPTPSPEMRRGVERPSPFTFPERPVTVEDMAPVRPSVEVAPVDIPNIERAVAAEQASRQGFVPPNLTADPASVTIRQPSAAVLEYWRNKGYVPGPPSPDGYPTLVKGEAPTPTTPPTPARPPGLRPVREGADIAVPTERVNTTFIANMQENGYRLIKNNKDGTTTFRHSSQLGDLGMVDFGAIADSLVDLNRKFFDWLRGGDPSVSLLDQFLRSRGVNAGWDDLHALYTDLFSRPESPYSTSIPRSQDLRKEYRDFDIEEIRSATTEDRARELATFWRRQVEENPRLRQDQEALRHATEMRRNAEERLTRLETSGGEEQLIRQARTTEELNRLTERFRDMYDEAARQDDQTLMNRAYDLQRLAELRETDINMASLEPPRDPGRTPIPPANMRNAHESSILTAPSYEALEAIETEYRRERMNARGAEAETQRIDALLDLVERRRAQLDYTLGDAADRINALEREVQYAPDRATLEGLTDRLANAMDHARLANDRLAIGQLDRIAELIIDRGGLEGPPRGWREIEGEPRRREIFASEEATQRELPLQSKSAAERIPIEVGRHPNYRGEIKISPEQYDRLQQAIAGTVQTRRRSRSLAQYNPTSGWDDFARSTLAHVPDGPPGLSIEGDRWHPTDPNNFYGSYRVIYRDPNGKPVVVARINQSREGTRQVPALAADRTRGALYARGVYQVGMKLVELDAAEASGSTSEYTKHLIGRIKDYVKSGVDETSRELAQTIANLMKTREVERQHRRITSPEELFALIEDMAADAGPQPELPFEPRAARKQRTAAEIEQIPEQQELGLGDPRQRELPFGKEPDIQYLHGGLGAVNPGETIRNFFKKGPKGEPSKFEEVIGLPAAATTIGDLSMPFRQGLSAIFTPEWIRAWGPMIRGAMSPEVAKAIDAEIRSKEIFQKRYNELTGKWEESFAEKEMGVPLIKENQVSASENQIASNWIESGGMFGKGRLAKGYQQTWGRVAKASNRGAATFLNHLRANLAERLVKSGEDMSVKAAETGWARPGFRKQAFTPETAENLNPKLNLPLARAIGDFINTATARAPLNIDIVPIKGVPALPLERAAGILKYLMFSPRTFFSRARMMSPATYVQAPPFVRKQYLKAALGTAAGWYTMTQIIKHSANALGIDARVGDDPDSADFGKVRIGNTRLDMGGGFLQFYVAAHRLISGEYKSSATGKTRQYGAGYRGETQLGQVQRFLTNKLSPVPKFVHDWFNASQYNPFHVYDRTAQLFIPLAIQDAYEVIQEDPKLLPFTVPITFFGGGSQIYSKGESIAKVVPPKYDWIVKGGGILPGFRF